MRIRQNGGAGSDVNISINGIGGKGVKIFIDELPSYLLGAAYDINYISQGIIQNIEIYKGTIPVKFGSDGLGGLINITTRQKNSEYLDASYSYGSWNTHQANFSANRRFGENDRFNISLDAFYTYSDNNYFMEDVDVFEEDGVNITKGRGRRFNDSFESRLAKASVGARNLSWADDFQIFSAISKIDKGVQHGVTAINPWGDTFSEETSWSSALTWRKFDKREKWDIGVSFGYVFSEFNFVDSVGRTYFWDQNFNTRPVSSEFGFYANGNTPEIDTDTFFARQSFNFAFSNEHKINLTSLFTRDAILAANPALDDMDQDDLDNPQYLTKNYTGLALESNLLDSRLTNIVSIKHFYQESDAIDVVFDDIGDLEKNRYSLFGYGDVIRFQMTDKLTTSLGYEYTIRQADSEELFGDFIAIDPNPSIRPEESHNINAGLNWETGDGKFEVAAAFFYRSISDKIFLQAGGQNTRARYTNLSATEVQGLEFTLKYSPLQFWNFEANATYKDEILKDVVENSGISESSLGARIANDPYFFANLITDYSIPNLSAISGELKLFYSLNYIHEFFPTWAEARVRATIPSQTIQNVSAVWMSPEERWSLGVECRNLFNELAFDNYSVQRPGRSFYIKARIFLQKL